MREVGAGGAALAILPALLATACGASLREEARRALREGIDPDPLVETLARSHAAVETTKRIFDVTLIEGRRRFAGEGALAYRAEPRRLRVDVFGPHDTPVLHVRLAGEALEVRLPREGEVLTGHLGDPAFARLTGERALVSPEILGALLGAYDVDRLLQGATRVAAAADGERRTLYILEDGAVHAFTLAAPDDRLVEVRRAQDGSPVYRVRFDDHREMDGIVRPWRAVLRDYVRDRQVVVQVTREHGDVDDLLDFESR